MSRWLRFCICAVLAAAAADYWRAALAKTPWAQHEARLLGSIHGFGASVQVDFDGSYSIAAPGIAGAVIRSDVEAVVDSRTLRSSAYPQHLVAQSDFSNDGGTGSTLTITHTGLPDSPDLVCTLSLFRDRPWGEIKVTVQNGTNQAISVASIRAVHATQAPVINLNGPQSADRILSDSYSEDRPQLAIRDLGDAPKGHAPRRGQPAHLSIAQSGESLFLGALTSDRLLDDLPSERARRRVATASIVATTPMPRARPKS